jgi:lysophospholipase L1-like esterase
MDRKRLVVALAAGAACVGGIAFASGALPDKQSNAGDSISQGFSANGWLGDHPTKSWVQGTDASVFSVYSHYHALVSGFVQEPESVTGAEMVGGGDSFAAQASRICAQSRKPRHVSVLLGANDVCNAAASSGDDPTANMYSMDTWQAGIDAGLDQLAACLPEGSTVQMLSMPRVTALYDAGYNKSFWCYDVVWPVAHICRIVTAEPDPDRRAAIGARIDDYNAAEAAEAARYAANDQGINPRGISVVSDWQGSIDEGHPNTSIGTVTFHSSDINGTDCFHPNLVGQRKLACAAWASNPDGSGVPVSSCVQ